MIIGRAYTCDPTNMISAIPSGVTIDSLTITNAVYDELYVSAKLIDLDNFVGDVPTQWGFDTRLHAMFNGDLFGGNVNFTEDVVELVRIKKRTRYDEKFKTIFEKKINSNADFEIYGLDYFEPVGDIEYAYVPIISGGESDYITNKVTSKFSNYFLCEKDISYPLILDAKFNRTLNQRIGVVETWGKRYPTIIKNGNLKYYSGTVECCFIQLNSEHCQFDYDEAWYYRNMLNDFLTNGKPKIFKDFEGNIYIVAISSSEISENTEIFRHVISRFDITQCGDAYSTHDLYYNDFIDVYVD